MTLGAHARQSIACFRHQLRSPKALDDMAVLVPYREMVGTQFYDECAVRYGIHCSITSVHRQAELVRIVLLSRPHVRD